MQQTLNRLRNEFLEMPGLRVTASQVQRLCGVDAVRCAAALDQLVATKFLSQDTDGRYVRFTGDPRVQPRAAKAALRRDRRPARAS